MKPFSIARIDVTSTSEQLAPGMAVMPKWGRKLHDAEVLAFAGELEQYGKCVTVTGIRCRLIDNR